MMPIDKREGLRQRPLIHPMLVPFPVVCFVGAFLSDLAYVGSDDMQWANFSVWLLTAGLVMAAMAALACLIDLFLYWSTRTSKIAWLRLIGATAAVVLSIVNAFVHSRDAYTSVVPMGIALSGLVVVILLLTGCFRWSMVRRYDAGVII